MVSSAFRNMCSDFLARGRDVEEQAVTGRMESIPLGATPAREAWGLRIAVLALAAAGTVGATMAGQALARMNEDPSPFVQQGRTSWSVTSDGNINIGHATVPPSVMRTIVSQRR